MKDFKKRHVEFKTTEEIYRYEPPMWITPSKVSHLTDEIPITTFESANTAKVQIYHAEFLSPTFDTHAVGTFNGIWSRGHPKSKFDQECIFRKSISMLQPSGKILVYAPTLPLTGIMFGDKETESKVLSPSMLKDVLASSHLKTQFHIQPVAGGFLPLSQNDKEKKISLEMQNLPALSTISPIAFNWQAKGYRLHSGMLICKMHPLNAFDEHTPSAKKLRAPACLCCR